MKEKRKWEDVVCELGEDLNISYGKVDDLLKLVMFCIKSESKLTNAQVQDWICTIAANNWPAVLDIFQKARDGESELKDKKFKIEFDRSQRALHNSLRGILRFYQTHKPA